MSGTGLDAIVGRLTDAAVSAAEETGTPGMVLGIQRGDERHVLAGGVTVNGGQPVTEDTLFRWCSITKVAMAMTALGYAERGVIDLDEPVGERFSALGPPARGLITPRMLLNHTSGMEGEWPESLAGYGEADDALARVIADYPRLRQFAPPGVAFGYCNTGYWLLGRLIEVVSGTTIEQAVRAQLHSLGVQPLVSLREAGDRPLAWPHLKDAETRSVRPTSTPPAMPRARFASGGLIGSMADLLRFGRAQLAHPGRLAAAGAQSVPADSPEVRQGLGWSLRDTPETRILGHSGFFAGYAAQLSIVPERDLVAGFLGNSDSAWFVREAVERELVDVFGGPASVAAERRVTPADGWYDYPEDEKLHIRAVGTGALVTVTWPDGRSQASPAESAPSGGYLLSEGPYAGCALYALGDAAPDAIRLGSRLGGRSSAS